MNLEVLIENVLKMESLECRKVSQKWSKNDDVLPLKQSDVSIQNSPARPKIILCVGVGIDGWFFANFISFLLFGNKFGTHQ